MVHYPLDSSLMTEDLMSLITSGKLPTGTILRHSGRRYSGRATVAEDGIRLWGRTYSTPSGAARAITQREVDGWLFWKLPSGEPLSSLRANLR